jgi:hypothetical protein
MPDKLPPMHPDLREIFRLAYVFRQKYQNPTVSAVFWNDASADLETCVRRCGNHPFAQAIFLCCYEDIERELKAKRVEQMRL